MARKIDDMSPKDIIDLVPDDELDAAATALGWPHEPHARAHALVALAVAARVRAERDQPNA